MKNNNKKKLIAFRLNGKLFADLKREAKKECMSVSELIRNFVFNALRKK